MLTTIKQKNPSDASSENLPKPIAGWIPPILDMTQAAMLGDRFRPFQTRVKDSASGNCMQDEYCSVKNDATLPAESEEVNFETQEDHLSHLLVSYLTEILLATT